MHELGFSSNNIVCLFVCLLVLNCGLQIRANFSLVWASSYAMRKSTITRQTSVFYRNSAAWSNQSSPIVRTRLSGHYSVCPYPNVAVAINHSFHHRIYAVKNFSPHLKIPPSLDRPITIPTVLLSPFFIYRDLSDNPSCHFILRVILWHDTPLCEVGF